MQLKDLDSKTVTISNEWIATNANEYTMKSLTLKEDAAVRMDRSANILYNVPAGMTKAQLFEMFELGEGETLSMEDSYNASFKCKYRCNPDL